MIGVMIERESTGKRMGQKVPPVALSIQTLEPIFSKPIM